MNFIYFNIYLFIMSCFLFTYFNKHVLLMLISLEFMMINVLFNMYMIMLLVKVNLYILIIFLSLSVCEGALGLSLLVLLVRLFGNDYIKCLSIMQW